MGTGTENKITIKTALRGSGEKRHFPVHESLSRDQYLGRKWIAADDGVKTGPQAVYPEIEEKYTETDCR